MQIKQKKTTKKPAKNEPKKVQLTLNLLKNLSEYYCLAVRRNSDSVENMRTAIWATFYHKSSTDANPQHQFCPSGGDSWCEWRKAEASGFREKYSHPPALDDDVQEVLKPIYEDLTTEDLLERCTGANTQNNNESFNHCVWQLAPKHIFCGKTIVEIATYCAACTFNEGYDAILKILEVMGVTIGPAAADFAAKYREERIATAERRSSLDSKEARTARRNEISAENKDFEEAEGILYGPGIAD